MSTEIKESWELFADVKYDGKVSNSWKMDKIREYINHDRNQADLIYAASIQPDKIKIPFDPTGNHLINQIFDDEAENFTDLVKASILFDISSFREKQIVENCRKYLQVEITKAREIKLHEWSTEHEGIPVEVNCLIIGQELAQTYTKSATYYCKDGHTKQVIRPGLTVICDCEKVMHMDQSTMKTGYYQNIMIQETMEEVKNGKPIPFNAVIRDTDVRNTYIGQRKKLIGVFRSVPQKGKLAHQIIINVISMQNLDDVAETQPTEDQIKYFHTISKKENYLEILSESISPEIKHEFLAKLCCLFSMVGSQNFDRILGIIHTLMVGDPATGKSKILEYMGLLIKKTAMAVGGTMSGSGVTVSMDTLSDRQRIPRPGIVPLCHNGLVRLDELNQLEEEDLGKLYESTASGRIHYNKGGYDLDLDAATTIVAGANPKYYIYDANHTIVDNLNLPAPLISRFDLIVNMQRNKKSQIERKEILEHINLIDKIGVTKYIEQTGLLQPEIFSAFLTYCKTFNPKFTDQSDKISMEFQLKMESLAQKEGSLPIDNRFYYSVKRIGKAIARLYFSDTVTPDHVILAIEIIKKTLMTFDMNVEAGQLQMNLQENVKTHEDAFNSVCKLLEQKNSDGRFSEDECIKTMVLQYPKEWPNDVKAAKYFMDCYLKFERLNKLAGRYKRA